MVDLKRNLFDPITRPEPIVNGPVEIGRVYAVADFDDLHLSSKLVEERTVGNGRFIQHDMVAGNPSGCQPFNLHPVRVNSNDCGLTKNFDPAFLESFQEQPSLEYGLQLPAQFLQLTGVEKGSGLQFLNFKSGVEINLAPLLPINI